MWSNSWDGLKEKRSISFNTKFSCSAFSVCKKVCFAFIQCHWGEAKKVKKASDSKNLWKKFSLKMYLNYPTVIWAIFLLQKCWVLRSISSVFAFTLNDSFGLSEESWNSLEFCFWGRAFLKKPPIKFTNSMFKIFGIQYL